MATQRTSDDPADISENKDITRSDIFDKSARELFDAIDKDGDGFVGATELRNYLISRLKLFQYLVTSHRRKRSLRWLKMQTSTGRVF